MTTTARRRTLDPTKVWTIYDREVIAFGELGARTRTARAFPAWSDETIYKILRGPRPEQPRHYVAPKRLYAAHAPRLTTFERAVPWDWALGWDVVIIDNDERRRRWPHVLRYAPRYTALVLWLWCLVTLDYRWWLAGVLVAAVSVATMPVERAGSH